MSLEESDDRVTDTEPTDTTERTTLLSVDRRGNGYDSDGETPVSLIIRLKYDCLLLPTTIT